jgi:hypothetical protein
MDAISGQQTAAMFKEGSGSQIAPTLQFEYAGDGESVGIFSGTDSTSLKLVNIFNPMAMPLGATKIFATVAWVDPTHINVYSDYATCLSGVVNCTATPVAGISQSLFGFFLQDGANTYYTPDSLNGGAARVLSYSGTSKGASKPDDLWTFAFEDGTDWDYNDRVFTVESITPVPEPASVVLFGTLLALCASGLRRLRVS